jgi:hypothetical protein
MLYKHVTIHSINKSLSILHFIRMSDNSLQSAEINI